MQKTCLHYSTSDEMCILNDVTTTRMISIYYEEELIFQHSIFISVSVLMLEGKKNSLYIKNYEHNKNMLKDLMKADLNKDITPNLQNLLCLLCLKFILLF